MFKQLKIYYVFVTLPFAMLLIGSAIFFGPIKATLVRNPHPQINYAIFCIILAGGIFIVINAHRLIREARTLLEYSGAIRAKTDQATLQDMANGYTGDISCLLQMVAASGGRALSHQEQAAIEHELNNARGRLNRRNALPQYLTGLLVGMGLLGTFIGLLATLNDISTLISSFADLDMNNASPILVFRTMIERMKAPMQSMGIAFSASMFGLLGSITLGLMMVGIRRLQGDIFSLLSSEIARHVEIALSQDSVSAVAGSGGGAYTGDEFKVLVRIEERLAEAARLQQRTFSAEMEDFRQQRTDMLRTLGEQIEASTAFRKEMQELGRQLGAVVTALEKGSGEIFGQISELTVHAAASAKESHKLLAQQVEEQKSLRESLGEISARVSEVAVHTVASAKESHKLLAQQVEEQKSLRGALDSYKIEERLTEAARGQQRALSAELDDLRKQRGDMLRTLAEQTEASTAFCKELQQLGTQLGTLFPLMERSTDEVRNQISELMIHMAADAKEAQKLLAMQVNEQMRLRDSLGLRVKSSTPEPESFFVTSP
ncbi:MAG TPA: hypothetical protein VI389_11185 [Geobacteraceae bacterium]